MRFTLSVELGNEAMSDALDIATALTAVVQSLESDHVGVDPIEATTGNPIRDYNGNTVGHWSVTA